MSAAVADVLDKAADVIMERGWCQGGREDAKGHVCVRGALGVAVEGHAHAGWSAFAHVDCALSDFLNRSSAAYNDDPDRTAEQVITALRECAAAQRASP